MNIGKAGMASTTLAMTPHTKIGVRFQVIPAGPHGQDRRGDVRAGDGAGDREDDDRHQVGVHAGRRLVRQRGVADHPVGMPPRNAAENSTGTQATSSHRLSAFSRGNAMSRAPIMIGTMKFPNGPVTMMIVARIIVRPCRPTTRVVGLRAEEAGVRPDQVGADHHRQRAADAEQDHGDHEVLDADDLVVGGEPEVPADALVLAGEERLVLVASGRARPASAHGPVNAPMPDHEPDGPADHGRASPGSSTSCTASSASGLGRRGWPRARARCRPRPPVPTLRRRMMPPSGSPCERVRAGRCRLRSSLPPCRLVGPGRRTSTGARHHVDVGLHVGVEQAAQLGAPHVVRRRAGRASSGSWWSSPGVRVDLDAHLRRPRRSG